MHVEILHKQALAVAKQYRQAEAELIEILVQIDALKVYLELGYPSLFRYVIDALALSEHAAYHFITVTRKAKQVPELLLALKNNEITISKAKSIASVLTKENCATWLRLAKENSTRVLEREVAKTKPEIEPIERFKAVGPYQVELRVTISTQTEDQLRRVLDILAQKRQRYVRLPEALQALAEHFLQREDPVIRARRILAKKERKNPRPHALRQPH